MEYFLVFSSDSKRDLLQPRLELTATVSWEMVWCAMNTTLLVLIALVIFWGQLHQVTANPATLGSPHGATTGSLNANEARDEQRPIEVHGLDHEPLADHWREWMDLADDCAAEE